MADGGAELANWSGVNCIYRLNMWMTMRTPFCNVFAMDIRGSGAHDEGMTTTTDTARRSYRLAKWITLGTILPAFVWGACTTDDKFETTAPPPATAQPDDGYQRQPLTNGWTAEDYQLGEIAMVEPLITEGLGPDFGYCVLDYVMAHHTMTAIVAMDDAAAIEAAAVKAGWACAEWAS